MSAPRNDRADEARDAELAAELGAENAELKIRLQELEDTLNSIHAGDVDALIVNDAVYTLESAHLASNRLRQDVLSQMEEAVFAFDADDHIIFVNAAAERRYGLSGDNVLGRHKSAAFSEVASPDADAALMLRASTSMHRLSDGRILHVEAIVSDLSDLAGRRIGTLAVVRDVTQRTRAEGRRAALVSLGERWRELTGSAEIEYAAAAVVGEELGVSRVGYGIVDLDTDTLEVARDWTAPGVDTLAGRTTLYHCESLIAGLRAGEVIVIGDVALDPRSAPAAEAFLSRGASSFVLVPVVEQGRLRAIFFVNDPRQREWAAEDVRFIEDVAERTRSATERARAAAALRDSERRLREVNESLEATVQARTRELMNAEQALRQAQKMEAVGQLTGGIAHDFNNMLASIGTSLQVLQVRLRQGKVEGLERYISMGQESAKRAAALTQRLLAFARRQTLDPKPTDMNRLVGGIADLIRRTVGPDVALDVIGAPDLWSTRIDPPQLENSLLNLCINARDAMLPSGGRLLIETSNALLDDAAAAQHDLPPGQYVRLAVTDTGVGMSPEVIKRVFDPFFTTKPMGQGTGLGLSMVYGFVRQSGGQVRIASEPGKGTTMSLYLPRFAGIAEAQEPLLEPEELETGDGETVLVIEDEPTIRELIAEVLEDAGYRTLTAPDGAAGLRLLQSAVRVDLLVTDVGLPGGMNGRQVADAARVVRPLLKVLFITGYAENAAVGGGQLEEGMAVMTKPFEITVLARKVRAMTGT